MKRIVIDMPPAFVEALAQFQKREQVTGSANIPDDGGLKEFFVGFFTAFAVHQLGHAVAEEFAAVNGLSEKFYNTYGRRN